MSDWWWDRDPEDQAPARAPRRRRSVYEDRHLTPREPDGDEDREGWVPLTEFVPFGSGSRPPEPKWPPAFTPLQADRLPHHPVGGSPYLAGPAGADVAVPGPWPLAGAGEPDA